MDQSEIDSDFERQLEALGPDGKYQDVPVDVYREFVVEHRRLMGTLAESDYAGPVLEEWDRLVEDIAARSDTEQALAWENARLGICLSLFFDKAHDRRDLALQRALQAVTARKCVESLLWLNDEADRRGINTLIAMLSSDRMHPVEREMFVSGLREAAAAETPVQPQAKAILEAYDQHQAEQREQQKLSRRERLELAVQELGLRAHREEHRIGDHIMYTRADAGSFPERPNPVLEINYERGELSFEYRRDDVYALPAEHPAKRLMLAAGFDMLRVVVEDWGALGSTRRHTVRAIKRDTRGVYSDHGILKLTSSNTDRFISGEVTVQTILERTTGDERWTVVQTATYPDDPWRPPDNVTTAKINLRQRKQRVKDLSDLLRPDALDKADAFFAFSAQQSRLMLPSRKG